MKALIIKEKDVEILRDRLKLEKFRQSEHQNPVEEIYRHFNYVIENWLKEQGL